MGARAVAAFHRALQLAGEQTDELKAEGLGLVKIQFFRQADAIVPKPQLDGAVRLRAQINDDLPGAAVGKGMFEGIGSQLMDDQPAADGGVNADKDVGAVDLIAGEERRRGRGEWLALRRRPWAGRGPGPVVGLR